MKKPRPAARPLLAVARLEDRVNPVGAFALSDNTLIGIETDTPATPSAAIPIVGLAVGDTLVDIDIRPQNGFLYGLGYNSAAGSVTLYSLSHRTGAATPITPATPNAFFAADGTTPVRVGVDASTRIGIDFNPLVDRLRVVTSNGQNFRLDPNSGAYVDGNMGAANA